MIIKQTKDKRRMCCEKGSLREGAVAERLRESANVLHISLRTTEQIIRRLFPQQAVPLSLGERLMGERKKAPSGRELSSVCETEGECVKNTIE